MMNGLLQIRATKRNRKVRNKKILMMNLNLCSRLQNNKGLKDSKNKKNLMKRRDKSKLFSKHKMKKKEWNFKRDKFLEKQTNNRKAKMKKVKVVWIQLMLHHSLLLADLFILVLLKTLSNLKPPARLRTSKRVILNLLISHNPSIISKHLMKKLLGMLLKQIILNNKILSRKSPSLINLRSLNLIFHLFEFDANFEIKIRFLSLCIWYLEFGKKKIKYWMFF